MTQLEMWMVVISGARLTTRVSLIIYLGWFLQLRQAGPFG
jgi:hypothetical protein